MNETKEVLKSKTIWGVIVSLAAKLAMGWFGVELTESIQQELAIALLTLVGASGDLWAIYGRIVAKARLGPTILPLALVCLLTLGGCASMSCLDKVAVTEVTITEAMKLTQAAYDQDLIGKDTARKAATLLYSANTLSDQAVMWCDIEDATALEYILQADRLILELETLIGE